MIALQCDQKSEDGNGEKNFFEKKSAIKPNQDEDNGVNVVGDVDVQGGEWEEDEDEPHLAYPGPHARGQVTDDEVMTKRGNCSSRKPP